MDARLDDPIQQARDRSQRYWASDGIPEIVMGGFWILWGAVLFLPIIFPNRALVRYMSPIFVIVLMLPAVLMKPLIHRWKERLTFPRTGYVELRPPSKAIRYAIVIITFAVAFAIAMLVRTEARTFSEWLPLGLGLLLAAGMLHASWKMHSLRLVFFSAGVAAVGFIASGFHFEKETSYALIIFTAGVALVCDGWLTLRSYVRTHPVPAGEAQ